MANTHDAIWDVLRGIDDPEMPISIVDLGIVAAVRLQSASTETPGTADGAAEAGAPTGPRHRETAPTAEIDVTPTFVGCPALWLIEGEIRRKVGLVPGVGAVLVRFVNDPPWSVDRISDAGRESLRRFGVTVPDAGSSGTCANSRRPAAESALVALGVARPQGAGVAAEASAESVTAFPPVVDCPHCGSTQTRQESRFGPTRCKMIYYCEACRNAFEHLKRV